jgi:hypothetical protein
MSLVPSLATESRVRKRPETSFRAFGGGDRRRLTVDRFVLPVDLPTAVGEFSVSSPSSMPPWSVSKVAKFVLQQMNFDRFLSCSSRWRYASCSRNLSQAKSLNEAFKCASLIRLAQPIVAANNGLASDPIQNHKDCDLRAAERFVMTFI